MEEKKGEKRRGRVTQKASRAGGIKIYLQVTMAATIAAWNFPLRNELRLSFQSSEGPRNHDERSLSSSILHRKFSDIRFAHLHNHETMLECSFAFFIFFFFFLLNF